MMQWLENVKNFFIENSAAIVSFLTPANIAAVITAIIVAIRNRKTTKANTEVGTGIVNSFGKLEGLVTTVNANTEMVECHLNDIKTIEAQCANLANRISNVEENIGSKFDAIEQKITAMLDVQSIVYNTIQNDDIRNNVQNIIANAKFACDNTRTALKEQINGLKEQMKTLVNETVKAVDNTVSTVEETVKNKKSKNSVTRY